MMNCKEATQKISESQERELAVSEKLGLRMHTFICVGCRNFQHQMDSIRTITREFAKGREEVELEVELESELEGEMKAEMKAEIDAQVDSEQGESHPSAGNRPDSDK